MQMLLTSKNSAERHLTQVLESTDGICFLGTPHCGSDLAQWGKVVTSVTKMVKRLDESVINVLQPGSEVLARIQQDFHTMLRAREGAGKHGIRMTCFYEDHNTPGMGLVSRVRLDECSEADVCRLCLSILRSYLRTARIPSQLITLAWLSLPIGTILDIG